MESQSAAFPSLEFLDLDGFRLAYREWGAPDAPRTVVLIHGITSSSLSWVRVAPVLGQRYRVIAVDLKGHGDSGQPPSGYHLAEQGQEVAALCTHLGLREATVIGHSWGGAIALILATSTAVVARLVLEDPAIGLRDADREQRANVEAGYAAMVGVERDEAERAARANLALGWSEADVAGKVDAAMKGSRAAVLAVFNENRPWDLRDRVAQLACPTLLLVAATDKGGIVDADARALAAANPHVQTVEVPGADHNIHRGRFDAFMAQVEPFLAASGD
jgi:pimeloyl-ACP methyl ester carboxylesterase